MNGGPNPTPGGGVLTVRAGAGTLCQGAGRLLGESERRQSARHDAKHRTHAARPR